MKAVICTKYGSPDVLVLKEVDKPVPKEDEVLIKICASAVTASDIFLRSFDLPFWFSIPLRFVIGIIRPRQPIIGLVFSGEVESSGEKIRRFKKGDQVYGLTGFGFGAYAEYKCMKETASPRNGCISLKPDNITHEEATAAAYGGLLALQSLEKGNIQQGQKVLVYGASGTTGTIAVQYAKYLGAEVTGICGTGNLDFVASLGAGSVLDYTKEESAESLGKYDLVLDAVGKMKTSPLKKAAKKSLNKGGRYLSIDDGDLLLDPERLDRIGKLIQEHKIKPVLDRSYPLEEIRAAHEYVGRGHKRGGVALTISRS